MDGRRGSEKTHASLSVILLNSMAKPSLNTLFQGQERMLFRHAAGVAGERAIRTDNAMTRYDDANRVSSGGSAHCARTARTASAPRKFSIGCLLYTSDAADERSSVDLG